MTALLSELIFVDEAKEVLSTYNVLNEANPRKVQI